MGRLAHLIAAPTTPLDPTDWALRHRLVTVLVAVQALVVAGWALAAGLGTLHALADVLPAAAGLAVALTGRLPRLVRTYGATIGLFAVSAAVVHLADGASVAHFHYFVMLIVLAQYEDARPFALGIAVVVVQHGVFGALLPGTAFPGDEARPWAQALVHGAFVLAAALVLVLNWRTNEALRRREARARHAAQQVLDVAGSALVALDPAGRVSHANPHSEGVLGRPLAGLDWFADVLVPAESRVAREAFEAHLEGRHDDPYDLECDVVAADGRLRRMTLRAALTRDDLGRVNGCLLAGQDVTEHREGERALARERDDLALLRRISREVVVSADPREPLVRGASELIGAPAVVLFETSDGGGLEITAAHGASRLVGRRIAHEDGPSGALLTARTGASLFVGDAGAPDAPLSAALVRALRTRSVAFRPVVVEGQPAGVLAASWSEARAGLDERTDGLLELMADEAAVALGRMAVRRRLEAAALTDPLTGAPNRRAWDALLPRELARARRTGKPLSIALLDLNAFKRLNDRDGHAAGDQALKAAVSAWSGVLRDTDALVRLGGDEFGVVLPDCPEDEALVVAGRVREATPHGPGTGVGLATWDGAEDGTALVRRADLALYEDKAAAGHGPAAEVGRTGPARGGNGS